MIRRFDIAQTGCSRPAASAHGQGRLCVSALTGHKCATPSAVSAQSAPHLYREAPVRRLSAHSDGLFCGFPAKLFKGGLKIKNLNNDLNKYLSKSLFKSTPPSSSSSTSTTTPPTPPTPSLPLATATKTNNLTLLPPTTTTAAASAVQANHHAYLSPTSYRHHTNIIPTSLWEEKEVTTPR